MQAGENRNVCCKGSLSTGVDVSNCTHTAQQRTEVCLTTIQFGAAQISKYLHNCIDFLSRSSQTRSLVEVQFVLSRRIGKFVGHRFCITNVFFPPTPAPHPPPPPKCMHITPGERDPGVYWFQTDPPPICRAREAVSSLYRNQFMHNGLALA